MQNSFQRIGSFSGGFSVHAGWINFSPLDCLIRVQTIPQEAKYQDEDGCIVLGSTIKGTRRTLGQVPFAEENGEDARVSFFLDLLFSRIKAFSNNGHV